MDNSNETPNSETGTNADDLEGLDAPALKEKLLSSIQEKDELTGKNRQLFERAKTAEGFEKIDGEWVKKPTTEDKPKPCPS